MWIMLLNLRIIFNLFHMVFNQDFSGFLWLFPVLNKFTPPTTITAEMNYIISFYITPRTSKGVINIYEADI